jgi:Leucine-rich repeat (LRR) protein
MLEIKGVYLQRNELSGMIPQSLMVLPNLTKLNIEGNNLMGSVNLASLWRLENLTSLVLSHNKLTVTVSEGSNSSSIYPSRLVELGLASCNMRMIPNLLMHVNHMEDLDLSNNKIRGDILNWIWERWNYDLMFLNLSHNWFTGMGLSSYVIPFSNILHIDVSSNKLQGHIPMPPSAEFLDYSNNIFSSLVPNFALYLTDTWYVRLSNNNIIGHLPHSICNTDVQVLDLSYNYFSGLVPPCLMETSLRVINFKENQFEGMLTSNISSECSVETINLHGNKIEGQLPRAHSINALTWRFLTLEGIKLQIHVHLG